MRDVPLDLQRKLEQRWAARFRRPASPVAPQTHEYEKQDQQPAATRKSKRKTERVEAAGSRPLSVA